MNVCDTCGREHQADTRDCDVCEAWWAENQPELPLDPSEQLALELPDFDHKMLHAH